MVGEAERGYGREVVKLEKKASELAESINDSVEICLALDPVMITDTPKITALILAAFREVEQPLRKRIAELETALRPLADMAVRIDAPNPVWPNVKRRPDSASIYSSHADKPGPNDLTIGHARAASRVLGV
jgi:hypothetical protein